MAKKRTTRKSASQDGDQVQIVRANVKREVAVSPTFLSFYANDTVFEVSPWDVRMTFGVIKTPPTKGSPTAVIESVAEVRMSPQHAKKMLEVLLGQLVGYEKRFGPIPQPND